jgi:hypothetical protein
VAAINQQISAAQARSQVRPPVRAVLAVRAAGLDGAV